MAKKTQHIVILGGGFGGVECFRRLNKYGRDDIRITLINKHNYSLFTPMLHEVATGSVSREDIVQPLREIITCCHNRFMEAEVQNIDFKNQTITTTRGKVEYDYVVVALGWVSNFFKCVGAEDYAFPLKNMEDAVALRNHLIQQYEDAATSKTKKERDERLRFVIVGGGLTGVEMAGQLADFCKEMQQLYPEIPEAEPEIELIHGGDRILQQLTPKSSHSAEAELKRKGVNITLNTYVNEVGHHEVKLSSGKTMASYTTIWASGGRSILPALIKDPVLNERGQLLVHNTLHIEGFKNAYGVGDCTDAISGVRPPSTAQAATQAGKIAAENILATIDKREKIAFKFHSKGELVPIGDWFGVAEIGNLTFSGRIAWWMRRTVFIQRLWSWANRLKVTLDWTIKIFRPRDTSQL